MSAAFGAPLLDLDAVDIQRLPKNLLDPKICQAYRVVVLSKRNNRLIVATADPSDQQAAEKIKFATQMGVDWIIAEYDKLTKMVEANTTTASEAMDSIIGDDFEFDESTMESSVVDEDDKGATSEVDDAPVVKFLQKMLMDAISRRRVRHPLRAVREVLPRPLPHRRRTARNRLSRRSRSRTSWRRASRSSRAWTSRRSAIPQDGRMKLGRLPTGRSTSASPRCPRCSARRS